MLAFLLAPVLFTYTLPSGKPTEFDMSVSFDGYLPILGGHTAKADLTMTAAVTKLEATPNGNPRATSEITALKLIYNGAQMSFGVANVKEIFPKTTIEFSPQGRTLKTDAPDGKLPFRLPGLDPKRFPDISYLPVEFPSEGIELNKPFKFKRQFGDTPVEYEVTPTAISDDSATVSIKLAQTYTTFEDARRNSVEEADAATKVTTKVEGAGTAVFDLKKGLVRNMELKADAASHLINLKSQVESDRKLTTTLKVSLKG